MPDSQLNSPLTEDALSMLRNVIQVLIDHPAALTISSNEGMKSVIFEVGARSEDLPKIIGRGGRTVSAIRTLLWNLACKHGRTYLLLIVGPDSSPGSRPSNDGESEASPQVIRRRRAA